MRVIGGRLRSRTLQAPAGLATRPTSDRLRETLFNVLAPRMEGAAFLDLYAGSGAVGIEAHSRGAGQVVFVERSPAALKVLRGNLEKLALAAGFRVEPGSVESFLRRAKGMTASTWSFSIRPMTPKRSMRRRWACWAGAQAQCSRTDAVVIAEHRRKTRLEESYGVLARTRLLEQGDAALSFYAVSETSGAGE